MKIQLKDRQIPRNKDGFAQFLLLRGGEALTLDKPQSWGVLDVFDEDEVVELVNRALYQLEYQKIAHSKYQQRQRDFEQPIKQQLKLLFPGTSWANATPDQFEKALKAAYPDTTLPTNDKSDKSDKQ